MPNMFIYESRYGIEKEKNANAGANTKLKSCGKESLRRKLTPNFWPGGYFRTFFLKEG